MSVITAREGELLVITINRPSKRNAIDRQTSVELEEAFNLLEDDTTLRVGIVTGAGGTFCAGSDLRAEIGSTFMPRGGEYGVIRRSRRKPLIAAVEGYAYGGGFEIALVCDLIVAAEDALFALPEATRGTLAASGGVFRTHQAIPRNIATEMLLTGKPLSAERAHAVGLVNRMVATGSALSEAKALAAEVCHSSPLSTRAVFEILERTHEELETTGWSATAASFESLQQGDEMREGINAFFERRSPRWMPQENDSSGTVMTRGVAKTDPTDI